MCTSSDTTVTTKIIITANPSIMMPAPMASAPLVSQVIDRVRGAHPAGCLALGGGHQAPGPRGVLAFGISAARPPPHLADPLDGGDQARTRMRPPPRRCRSPSPLGGTACRTAESAGTTPRGTARMSQACSQETSPKRRRPCRWTRRRGDRAQHRPVIPSSDRLGPSRWIGGSGTASNTMARPMPTSAAAHGDYEQGEEVWP